jgi:hypothetical protein
MIQNIRTQANTIRTTMKPTDMAATVLLWPFWALGWLAGFVWHVVTLVVAAVMVGFKTGRGQ